MHAKANVTRIRWRWGIVATLAMMLLSLYPQVHFWVVRGGGWNGSYAAIEGVGDEIAYSAYVNALINGRPRRNDPYTGRDFSNSTHQPDSLFSIQFVPAYVIALPARALGISASTAFILLSPIAAGAAALALFWLLALMAGHDELAAAGVLVVLCLGTLVAGHGHFTSFFGQEPLYNYLMFLRRYQPAAPFPLFIVFCALVWLSVTNDKKGRSLAAAAGATIVFTVLVFSYVYLWTAAFAWLACVGLLWTLARPARWTEGLRSLAVIAFGALCALAGFALIFSNRARSMDSVQALEFSRVPDLLRVPELIGIAVLAVLCYLKIRRSIDLRQPLVLFVASFAALPIVLFNQQVLTGHSLQPLHYEMFVANYSVLIAVVSACRLRTQTPFRIRLRRKALLGLAILAFEWGAYETLVATRGSMPFDQQLDDARAVALRLGSLPQVETADEGFPTVLSTDLIVADSVPTSASQSVLWAPHMMVFSGVTNSESKERFYQYLYYTGVTAAELKTILRTEARYGFAVGMFGFERTIRGLSRDPKPITLQELESELENYSDYISAFGLAQARKVKISYLVANADERSDFRNLDRWYQRDQGERIGKFILYRTSLRNDLPEARASNEFSSGPGEQ